MRILATVLLFLAFSLEITLTSIPLVFILLVAFVPFYRNNFMFFLAFLFGLLLDFFAFRDVGISSIFFVSFIFLMLLYQSKLEISTNYFVFIATFLGSFLYIFIFSFQGYIILEALTSAVFGILIFNIFKRIKNAPDKFHLSNS